MATEEFVNIPSCGQNVYGILHLPDEPASLGIVYCSPFAEEQKSTYRVFVEYARELAPRGIASLRFDYRGTGDSDGYFQDYILDDWVNDTVAAVECLKDRAGLDKVVVLGVRFGGLVALLAAQRSDFISSVVLWQPILDGSRFHKMEMRRFLIRQMMTKGKATKGAEELDADAQDNNVIDMDGYLIRKELTDAIKETNLTSAEATVPERTLLFQISHTEKVSKEYEAFREHHPSAEFKTIVCEPFWNRIGFVDTSPVLNQTTEWLIGE